MHVNKGARAIGAAGSAAPVECCPNSVGLAWGQQVALLTKTAFRNMCAIEDCVSNLCQI